MGSECRHDGLACSEVQWELCRLAVGAQLGDRGFGVARHVRGCASCESFIDELAGLRRWIERVPRPSERQYDERLLDRRARDALARELDARLARDLVAFGAGNTRRPLPEREGDVRRLALLVGEQELGVSPRREAVEAVVERAPIDRRRAVELAAQLDPLGLDVALAWLAVLVRAGEEARANAVTEHLLGEVF